MDLLHKSTEYPAFDTANILTLRNALTFTCKIVDVPFRDVFIYIFVCDQIYSFWKCQIYIHFSQNMCPGPKPIERAENVFIYWQNWGKTCFRITSKNFLRILNCKSVVISESQGKSWGWKLFCTLCEKWSTGAKSPVALISCLQWNIWNWKSVYWWDIVNKSHSHD